MKWFKHYGNATTSNALTQVIAAHGMSGYGRYWILIEAMSEKFDGINDDLFVFSTRHLRDLMCYHRTHDLIKFLSSLDQVGIMSHVSKNHVIEIRSSIMLELMGKDFKYTRAKRGENDPKIKTKTKIKTKIKQVEKIEPADTTNKLHKEIMNLWNSGAASNGMPGIKALSPARVRKLKVACKMFNDIEDWIKIFNVTCSKFFVGRDGRQFIPSWDYVFRNENYIMFHEEHTADLDTPGVDKELSQQEVRTIMGM